MTLSTPTEADSLIMVSKASMRENLSVLHTKHTAIGRNRFRLIRLTG
jgi:hypothetical protein